MLFYSIHVIAEYNLSGSEIICRQIPVLGDQGRDKRYHVLFSMELGNLLLRYSNSRAAIFFYFINSPIAGLLNPLSIQLNKLWCGHLISEALLGGVYAPCSL